MKKKYSTLILYLLFFIYFEWISKILMFNQLPNKDFIIVILFSCSIAFLIYFFASLINGKKHHFVLLMAITIFYIFNYLYFSLLSVPFSVSTLDLASQAMDFYEIGFHLIITKIIEVMLFLIPILCLFIYQNKFDYTKKDIKNHIFVFILVIGFHITALFSLNIDKKNLYSAYNLYYNIDFLTTSNNVLGIYTTQRLSIKRSILGFKENLIFENPASNTIQEKEYNKLDLPFDDLIANESDENVQEIYKYLQNKEVTNKNEYTGIYKGKNLIFILAEGFNSIAVDPTLTPTLYKLIHEGLDFTNYYSPVFLSTTGGEFQAMTSLIPTQEILGMWRNNNPYLPYALGNAFQKIGYHTSSYHNWSYKYYDRDSTMSTLGFDNFLACGNGLENRMDCTWLPSDVDLINSTFDDYKKNEPFLTYYITVSGHAPYNFNGGNSIAQKNESLVEDLPYSDSVKSYLASQLELENALTTLINQLKKNKILDDTVIVLTGDHYPYTLSTDEINEISSYERDEIIEVNHSNLIIWNNKNEHKVIDKVSSQLDVLPTILNLFGIDYDSRLFVGKDIFSDAEGFAIFSNRSWISDKGFYLTNSGFVPKKDQKIDENYINEQNNHISNSFSVSKMIMEKDLYKKLINSEEK